MKTVDAAALQLLATNTSGVQFRPYADEITVFSNTTDRLAKGLVSRLVSTSDDALKLRSSVSNSL